MSEELKQTIEAFLTGHNYLNLATASPDGKPLAHTVAYVNIGPVVYFGTGGSARKSKNIKANPAVAYTVDDDDFGVKTQQFLQMEGKAEILTNKEEAGKIQGMFLAKFPQFKDMPEMADSIMIKIVPKSCLFSDFAKGFAHNDIVAY